jgi:hypothetical protein
MPDADESPRQRMQQKAPQELIDVQSQESLLVLVSGVAPPECNLVIDEGNESVIGNRNAMGVGAQVVKHLTGPAERRFAIDNPSQSEKLTDQTPKQLGLSQAAKQAVELELSGSVSLLERFEELATENFAEHSLREKKARISRAYPAGVIAR